ncbi:hypothetical protein PHYBLDRAFT_70185 [Phycomyces blakesleeanus NRRL 1555(-)]|uniref:Uncharacterized protein n=1 Tax=Phycomyces blakesleeanus (strain ATCC 8743b / DSM 1359 / FGSC 10004 / NBRC 33097 / NRRL 1555) TaxID=763407 RepID=A0A162T820_PHYB8|nr:hypothetical protein PHYBLDRAFT_70185 [Phycomyces blakesleeanus NRRL 1555(-)]OAD66822.1 hypothetical protein PHYBLDRAFT_70185 [Phycomyces blakesleeanus NRRL 1555(-)]|eukprot:XP_018284862.1 hypothetical protein PHYBLDRAFT_70185 [Phycomyces blakesleeanus NRRL 1555(-)]
MFLARFHETNRKHPPQSHTKGSADQDKTALLVKNGSKRPSKSNQTTSGKLNQKPHQTRPEIKTIMVLQNPRPRTSSARRRMKSTTPRSWNQAWKEVNSNLLIGKAQVNPAIVQAPH